VLSILLRGNEPFLKNLTFAHLAKKFISWNESFITMFITATQ